MHAAPLALAGTLLLAAGLAPVTEAARPTEPTAPQENQRKGWYSSSRYGFELREPGRKWNRVAVKTEEEWLAVKFQSEKKYFFTNEETGWTFSHQPEIQAIVFPKEVMKKRGKQVDEVEGEDGVKKKVITFKNPYKSYDDFVERTFQAGGFHLAEEEETEIDDLPVTQLVYEATVLTQFSGPKYLVTWIYHTEDVDYAIQCEVLIDAWPKIERQVERVFRSFGLVERTGPITHSGDTQDQLTFTRFELSDGTPRERRTKRQRSEKVMHERAVAKLPPEWEHQKKGRVLVLSHTDDRYADKVQQHTNNMLDWLDEHLGFIGEDEYVRAPIVRICRDQEERASYARGVNTGGWGWTSVDEELVTCKDDTGWIGYEVDNLNWQIYRYWITERNGEFAAAMPEWIDNGLEELLEKARMDGRRPDFRRDSWRIQDFKIAEREERLSDPRDLFVMTREDFYGKGTNVWDRWAESAMLVRFLLTEDSRRCRQARGLFEDYCRNLLAVIEETEKEYSAEFKDASKAPETEEEEKKRAAKMRNLWKDKEKALLERTFERTFGDWTERDWEQFTEAFRESVG